MRCSLLTLSSYLDRELPPEQSGELEAHLIACQRCSAGLGYLREEAERIHGLAPAHAAPGAADRLLIEVGLAAPMHPENAAYMPSLEPSFEFSVDLRARAQRLPNGTNAGALVDALVVPEEKPAIVERPHNGTGAANTVDTPPKNGVVQHEDAPPPPEPVPAAVAAPTLDAEPPAPAPVTQPLFDEPMPPAVDDAPPAPAGQEEPAPDYVEVAGTAMAAAPPAQRAAPSWFDRVRDAIAVRLALMRSPAADELDENVQIVSGTGAPGWGARRAQDTHRERRERMAATSAAALERPTDIEMQREAAHEFRVPSPMPVDYTPQDIPMPGADVAAEIPAHTAHAEAPPAIAAEALPEGLPAPERHGPEWYAAPPEPVTAEPAAPGRHLKALQTGRASAKRTWAGVRSFGGRGTGRRLGLGHAFSDRRLWLYGACIAVLMLVGLLVGKTVTLPRVATSPVTVPNPTAVALNPPSAAGTPAPTVVHTPVPTVAPTPAGPNPAQLTGVHTLGSGGTGFQVQDLRFGAHPGDFRIVYDLSGASAALPDVQVGFGNPTTLYVEFSGTSAGGAPAQPAAGGVVTSIKQLPASTLPGRLVYQLTLSRPVSLSTLYLRDPARLVIDLS